MIGFLASSRIRELTISLIALFYLVEQRSLSSRVVGTKLLGAFEHQMFQVVSKTSSLSRVVLRTSANGNVGLDAGFLWIYGEVYFQTIVQRVDASLRQIAIHCSVLKIFCLNGHSQCHQTGCNQKFSLHNLFRGLILK